MNVKELSDLWYAFAREPLAEGEMLHLRLRSIATDKWQKEFFPDFESAAAFALARRESHDVYWGVNPRRGRIAGEEGVSRLLCLHVDIDAKKFASKDDAFAAPFRPDIPAPSLLIDSGGGYHCYWLIDPLPATAENKAQAKRIMAALCEEMGIDRCIDTSRILRVPGCLNHKPEYGKPLLVTKAFDTPNVCHFDNFVPLLGRHPAPRPRPVEMASDGLNGRHRNDLPTVERIREWLSFVPPTEPYEDWLEIAMSVHSAYPDETGYELIDSWSSEARREAGLNGGLFQHGKWEGFRRSDTPGAVTIGTLIARAQEAGWEPPSFELVDKKQGQQATEEWEPPIPFDDRALPDFPLGVLPRTLGGYVAELAEATQTRTDLGGMLALAALSAAVGGKVRVCPADGWHEPLNTFIVVALPPASRKSAVFAEITAPIREWERRAAERMGPQIAEAESSRRIAESALKKAEHTAANGKTEERANAWDEAKKLSRELAEMRVPTTPRVAYEDITPEKLAGVLCEQGGSAAILSAEGGTFDIISGRYSDGKANLDVYLHGHAGEPLIVDRTGRPSERIDSATLTIGLAVQPDVIQSLGERRELRGRGLLARVLYCIPANNIGSRSTDPPPVSERARGHYNSLVTSLLGIKKGIAFDGREQPHTLALDYEAQEERREIARWVERELAEGGKLGHMQDWGGKLVGAVMRIAGLLHCARHPEQPWGTKVSRVTVEQAWAIGQYLIAHAEAAFDLMGADPMMASARFLLRWMQREELVEFTKSYAQQENRRKFKRVEDIDRPLQLLEQFGYIRKRPTTDTGKAGRPASPTYDVNPLGRTENTDNTENCPDERVFSISSILSTPLSA